MMAFRVLHYIILFYRDLERQGKLENNKLPFVFPIVLYNGDALWTACTDINDMIEYPTKSLKKSGIRSRYNLVSVNALEAEKLLKLQSAVAALFYMEKGEFDTFESACEFFVETIYSLSDKGLQKVLLEWLTHSTDNKEVLENVLSNTDITKSNQEEVTTMLATYLKKRDEKLIEKGREEGIEKGIEKGREEGIEKGIEKGREEGREEGIEKAQCEMAKQLLIEGISLQTIKNCTGLSEKELQKLKRELS
jgi:hypothetical protein